MAPMTAYGMPSSSRSRATFSSACCTSDSPIKNLVASRAPSKKRSSVSRLSTLESSLIDILVGLCWSTSLIGAHSFKELSQFRGDIAGGVSRKALLNQTLGFAEVLAVVGQGGRAAVEDGPRRLVIVVTFQELRRFPLMLKGRAKQLSGLARIPGEQSLVGEIHRELVELRNLG